MPGIFSESKPESQLNVKPLHPTFGAEVEGVNFETLTDDDFEKIRALMAKVTILSATQWRATEGKLIIIHV